MQLVCSVYKVINQACMVLLVRHNYFAAVYDAHAVHYFHVDSTLMWKGKLLKMIVDNKPVKCFTIKNAYHVINNN